MSRKATPLDNAPIESFFHILKVTLTHNRLYASYAEFKEQFKEFIQYYNNKRIKEKLGSLSFNFQT
ncbi:IS3 family transposase [Weissella coleopterorum]|uniref:IS3 family transposase n=1 Tax=Weissella coleopterorum TaxID=2714949 RepID=A0A6G8AYD5_9LACO|nr:IS3 family transposase [Weissella coleopterorum]